MIIGLGIDIVEVARIEKAMRKERFLEKLFTPAEIKDPTDARHIAGRWAAKEAIAKAVPIELGWLDVEVLNDESGSPYVKFSENVNIQKDWKLHISITHENAFAAAVAVLEQS